VQFAIWGMETQNHPIASPHAAFERYDRRTSCSDCALETPC
jgi:hypothetical protein